jgi:hypothetical protein
MEKRAYCYGALAGWELMVGNSRYLERKGITSKGSHGLVIVAEEKDDWWFLCRRGEKCNDFN